MTPPNEPSLPGSATGRGVLAGKSAVVTGATDGIGFQTARLLAGQGATVLITGRNPRRGADAVAEIREAARHDRVEFISVDHSTVPANEQLAAALTERFADPSLPDRVQAIGTELRTAAATAGGRR